jgi:hypothetical protein
VLRPTLLSLLLALLFAAVQPATGGERSIGSGGLTLTFLETEARGAPKLLALSRDALEVVSRRLGLAPPEGGIEVFLASSDRHFEDLFDRFTTRSAPSWALAVAFPSRRAVILKLHKNRPVSNDNIELTLRHELAHLLHRALSDQHPGALPRWLDEGLAMWASGQRLNPLEVSELATRARNGTLPAFKDLEARFPRHSARAQLAYQQSLSFVQWLEERLSSKGKAIPDFLAELRESGSLDVALFRVTHLDDPMFDWRDALSESSSTGDYLLHHLGVWQLMSLLCIVAIIRHLIRRRRLLERLAFEDSWRGDDDLP